MRNTRNLALRSWSYAVANFSPGLAAQGPNTRSCFLPESVQLLRQDLQAWTPKWQTVSFVSPRKFWSASRVLQQTYLDELALQKQKGADHGQEQGAESAILEAQQQKDQEVQKALDTAGKGTDGILQVVERFSDGGDLTASSVAQVFKQLAKVAAESNMGQDVLTTAVHPHPRFQNLVDMALTTACSMSNQELADVLASAGTLHYGDQMLLDGLAQRLIGGISTLSPQHIVDTVDGLKGADHSPGKVLFDELKARAEELSEKLSPEQQQKLRRGYQHFGYSY